MNTNATRQSHRGWARIVFSQKKYIVLLNYKKLTKKHTHVIYNFRQRFEIFQEMIHFDYLQNY